MGKFLLRVKKTFKLYFFVYLFIYLWFYIALNTVKVISRWVVGRTEETSVHTFHQGSVL